MDRFAAFPPQHVTTMAPGQPHPHNQTIIQVLPDVKPRLTKDQHDILENHFAANPKPSTSAKKTIADAMGVPLDKINNWFQNRRAKVKQEYKKKLNAYNLLHHPQIPTEAFVPSTASSTNLFDPTNPMSVTNFHPDGVALPTHSDANGQQQQAFAAGHQLFNPMVPTILESTQPGSSQGIVDNLKAAGYPMQDVSGANADCSFVFDQQIFPSDFSADSQYILSNPFANQFSGQFMDVPTFSEVSYQPYATANGASGQSTDCKTTISPASPKSSNATLSTSTDTGPMPTLTSTLATGDWAEEKKATSSNDENSPRDPLDSNGLDTKTLPQSLIDGAWTSATASGDIFAPSPSMFMNHNPSLPTLVSPENGDQDGSLMMDPHDMPIQAFMRRNSSTTALTESMNAVDIHNQSIGESVQRPASQATSLAARRQRPRPAALGAAALRSSSYSAGMPVSPGANLTAPEQALRRIRSSGISNNSRIQKSAPGSGQRSPRNPSFADAVRHVSTSTVSSPAVSTSGNNLAPPTPLTPGEITARYPQAFWQFQGLSKPGGSNLDKINANGVAVSWAADGGSILASSVSPPSTPLDSEQMLQYRNFLMQQQARLRYTPPQSAPATQQTFSTTAMIPEGQVIAGTSSLGSKVMHSRRPSLPEGQADGMDAQGQWPVLPMFPANGDVHLSESTQQMNMGVAGSDHTSSNEIPRSVQAHATPFPVTVGGQPAVVKPDFSVHEYTPPQTVGGPVSPPRGNEVPKTFHFSHAGPRDFEA